MNSRDTVLWYWLNQVGLKVTTLRPLGVFQMFQDEVTVTLFRCWSDAVLVFARCHLPTSTSLNRRIRALLVFVVSFIRSVAQRLLRSTDNSHGGAAAALSGCNRSTMLFIALLRENITVWTLAWLDFNIFNQQGAIWIVYKKHRSYVHKRL